LELEELLDIVLRIAGLEILETGLFQVADSRHLPGAQHI
jgi:hypothetical protein